MAKALMLSIILLAQPFAANAGVIIRVPDPHRGIPIVSDPSEQNELPGGLPQIVQVTYDFNNLEYEVPDNGFSDPFDLTAFGGGICQTSIGEFGQTKYACFFPLQPAGFYQLSDPGSIDKIRFTVPVPESSTWATFLLGVGCVGVALRSRGRSTTVAV